MRQLLISTALLLAVPTFGAAQGSTCPDGTMTCNIATVGDTDISAPQTIGDTVNPTYSPDSASANAPRFVRLPPGLALPQAPVR